MRAAKYARQSQNRTQSSFISCRAVALALIATMSEVSREARRGAVGRSFACSACVRPTAARRAARLRRATRTQPHQERARDVGTRRSCADREIPQRTTHFNKNAARYARGDGWGRRGRAQLNYSSQMQPRDYGCGLINFTENAAR